VLKSVALDGARFNETLYTWMVVGGLKMEVGFLIDGLSAMMMCVVTFVSLAVHIYTIGYMEEDDGYNRFFSYISLFTFSMLMLVMSNNMLQLFFGWEAVGLVSYLLIGFWFNKPSAIFANMKAFLVNRVGDFGFILGHRPDCRLRWNSELWRGLCQVWRVVQAVFARHRLAAGHGDLYLPVYWGNGQVRSVSFARLVARFDGRPTPISALIHAATMVTAGIFMVARMSPLFELSDTALNLVLVIGGITALFMGFLGHYSKRHQACGRLFDPVAIGLHDGGIGCFGLFGGSFPS
jgi:NADH-quinone oxidoreductase subunit L